MDPVILSRIQFALTIGFHFLFPPLTIGLAWLLVVIEYIGWRRDQEVWRQAGRLFAKVLALTFAVGVATGIVMEFQFGTNWSRYSKFVGDIFGAPLAAEGVLTFFLESGFLGLYLFGRNRVSKGMHWFSILMVAVGATLSAFWILVANSWQQTPAGFVVQNGRAELASFYDAVFNASMWVRFLHTVTAAIVCGAFFLAGLSAYLLRKNAEDRMARRTLTLAVVVGLIFSILVAFPTGHDHAKQVARTQPEKFAAIEGLYTSQKAAPLVMFAYPLTKPPELKAKFEIKGLLSWMAFGDVNAHIPGIDQFPADEIPPLWLTFVSFHNMVLLGSLFIVIMAWAVIQRIREKIWTSRRFLLVLIWAIPFPLAACQLGWITAEVGRQPWIVYKLMKTADAVSVTVPAGQILFSIILFVVVYSALGSLYIYLLVRKMGHADQERLSSAVGQIA